MNNLHVGKSIAGMAVVAALALPGAAAPERTIRFGIPSALETLRPGEVRPQGWLRDRCVAARNGYISRLDEVDQAFPRAWNSEFHPRGKYLDWSDPNKGAWCTEGGAYWFEGLVKLAWELDDPELKAYATKRLTPLLERMNPNSIAFVYWMDRRDPKQMEEIEKANHGFIVGASGRTTRAFLAYYEATGDERALRALKWCLDDPRFYFFGNPVTLPAAGCDTWRYCGDEKLAAALENFYAKYPSQSAAKWPALRYGRAVEPDTIHMRVRDDKDKNANWEWRLQHGVLSHESAYSFLKLAQWKGDAKLLADVRSWADYWERNTRQVHGVTVADEQYGAPGEDRGTETCTVAGDILLYSTLAGVTGEGSFGDHVERSFFNAGAACVSRDWMHHVYFQAPNRTAANGKFFAGPSGKGGVYKRKHWPLCCTAALARILPVYVQQMWMKPADGGLAAVLYGPNVLETKLDGEAVRIETKTDYPFAETVAMTVGLKDERAFPLKLRIPAWCRQASVSVNGQTVEVTPSNGFATVVRTWRNGDSVTLRLPMEPAVEKVVDANQGGKRLCAVTMGPLLFAAPVSSKDENTPSEGARSDWKLDSARALDGAKVTRTAMPAVWDWPEDAPVRVNVKAADGTALSLVPYGCARLRVSLFPDVADAAPAATAPSWPEVTREAKPWAYNWWMASAVDREGLEAQCAAMEAAGLGGFHVIPIYGAKGYEAKYLQYLSPEWMAAFRDAVEIGAKHGLGVDMTMGNGWCFGGPQLKPEQGCWKLEKTPDGRPPYVTWKLTGQKVKRAGPGGSGPMMDPFSVEAIEAFLAPYAVFDAPGAAKPLSVYHDSWEYFKAGWSPALFDAFKAKRGYDLRGHLKELAGIGEREEVSRIRCDYRETLSDLVIDDVFPKWVDWAHRRGIRVRNEAHGTCANWLDFYALADMPETEMFAAECRDILVSKFASSAAHVTGKKFVTSESCTWLAEHFTETLGDFKTFVDRLFLSGVNHMYYHGCCYSPVDAVWPGWCFYASCEMNPRNPVWRDAKYLNAYIARVQAMFQACEPDNDTLVYWPLRDYWWEADGFEQMMSVHNATNWFGSQPIGAVARSLSAEGCAFDYVSDRQLQRLDLSRYAKIVVPPCRHMPEATKAAIAKFRERPVRLEPFAAAGLAFSRYRRGDESVYFIVNTNDVPFVGTCASAAKGAMWWMDPMTGKVRPLDGCLELAPFESGFLVGRVEKVEKVERVEKVEGVEICGPWKLRPVCGGPELPVERTMDRLVTWSRNADGSENSFSGTMLYRTEFDWKGGTAGVVTLDFGSVSQSARIRINGKEAGFAIMAPYRVSFSAALLHAGNNALEVEVTSTGANRIRWNDRTGVRWKYFTDANVVAYGYRGQLDASKWPLAEYGLFGPVRLIWAHRR